MTGSMSVRDIAAWIGNFVRFVFCAAAAGFCVSRTTTAPVDPCWHAVKQGTLPSMSHLEAASGNASSTRDVTAGHLLLAAMCNANSPLLCRHVVNASGQYLIIS